MLPDCGLGEIRSGNFGGKDFMSERTAESELREKSGCAGLDHGRGRLRGEEGRRGLDAAALADRFAYVRCARRKRK